TDDEAFALVTINPAKQLRIDNRVGSLDVGKDADVVIWNHHPLSSYAIAERVYIDGQKYYDRTDDQKRMTELAREKETLVTADRGERRAPSTTTDAASPRPRDERGTTGTDVAGRLQPSDGTNGTNGTDGDRSTKAVALQQAPSGAAARPRTATRGVVAITNA